MHKLLLVLFMLLAVTSCQNVFADGGNVFKVKGLYLGMSIDNANSVLSNLGYSLQVTAVTDPSYGRGWYLISDGNGFGIFADQNKMVYRINFSGAVVDSQFNVSDLPAKDFARKFMDSYNIPSMDVVVDDGAEEGEYITYWRYVSPDGYKVEIYDNKQVLIEAVTKATDMKFN